MGGVGQWQEVNGGSQAGEDPTSPPLPFLPGRGVKQCLSVGVPRAAAAAAVTPSPGHLPEIRRLRPQPDPQHPHLLGGPSALLSRAPPLRGSQCSSVRSTGEAAAESLPGSSLLETRVRDERPQSRLPRAKGAPLCRGEIEMALGHSSTQPAVFVQRLSPCGAA